MSLDRVTAGLEVANLSDKEETMSVNSQQEAELLAEEQPGTKLIAQLPTVKQPVEPAVKPPQPGP